MSPHDRFSCQSCGWQGERNEIVRPDTLTIACPECGSNNLMGAGTAGARDPRHNADDAYTEFIAMPTSEWRGLFNSLVNGGVLEPAEMVGYERALAERGLT